MERSGPFSRAGARRSRLLARAACTVALFAAAGAAARPLPSWNDAAAKASVLAFVEAVTTESGADYVPPGERIAVFDNDGTLWAEQPMYVQATFALDRVKVLAPQHPEWKTQQPFAAALAGDAKGLAASGEKGIVELMMATHAGTTTDEFSKLVSDWIATAKHPRFGRPYTELTYQPMLELLAYLREKGFETYIVSGGGGDQQMLQWTAAGGGSRFLGLIHHTDAQREWAYDRKSAVGQLDKALDEANARGWTVVDMKRDWKRVFSFD